MYLNANQVIVEMIDHNNILFVLRIDTTDMIITYLYLSRLRV